MGLILAWWSLRLSGLHQREQTQLRLKLKGLFLSEVPIQKLKRTWTKGFRKGSKKTWQLSSETNKTSFTISKFSNRGKQREKEKKSESGKFKIPSTHHKSESGEQKNYKNKKMKAPTNNLLYFKKYNK